MYGQVEARDVYEGGREPSVLHVRLLRRVQRSVQVAT